MFESVHIISDHVPHVEKISDKASLYIRVIARIFLLAWFIDDTIIKCFDWSTNLWYINYAWNCGNFVANVAISISVIGVFVSSYLILVQKYVIQACCFLMYVVVIQVVSLMMVLDLDSSILFREASVVGSILMLLADSLVKNDSSSSGKNLQEENRRRNILQLIGRSLTVFIFVTNIQRHRSRFETLSSIFVIQEVVGGTLIVLVTLGYKTKVNALALAAFLTIYNVFHHDWWNHSPQTRNFARYDFFLTWAVIGGLLMVVELGPGGISVDEGKKYL